MSINEVFLTLTLPISITEHSVATAPDVLTNAPSFSVFANKSDHLSTYWSPMLVIFPASVVVSRPFSFTFHLTFEDSDHGACSLIMHVNMSHIFQILCYMNK